MKTISVALEPSFSTKPNKGGRPRKEIDQNTFEKLCEIQCMLEEIAAVTQEPMWCNYTSG